MVQLFEAFKAAFFGGDESEPDFDKMHEIADRHRENVSNRI